MKITFTKDSNGADLILDSSLIQEMIESTDNTSMQGFNILKTFCPESINRNSYLVYYTPYENVDLAGYFFIDNPSIIDKIISSIGATA